MTVCEDFDKECGNECDKECGKVCVIRIRGEVCVIRVYEIRLCDTSV